MNATYHFLAGFAQTWGLVYFVGIFACVLVYALAPWRKQQFDEAAHTPLRED